MAELEYPKKLTYECPGCKRPVKFTDYGRDIVIKCDRCHIVIYSRTSEAVVQAIKNDIRKDAQIHDNHSTSGRPVKLTQKETEDAMKLLDW